jgi:glutamyl-tRNA reductase
MTAKEEELKQELDETLSTIDEEIEKLKLKLEHLDIDESIIKYEMKWIELCRKTYNRQLQQLESSREKCKKQAGDLKNIICGKEFEKPTEEKKK